MARALLGPTADFDGEFQTGDLANGWNFYRQPLKMKPNGIGILLQILPPNQQQIVFVITMGNSAAAVNRVHTAISDHLSKRARIAP